MKKIILTLAFAFSTLVVVWAQEASHQPKIRGAIMMANSHVPKAFEGDKKVVSKSVHKFKWKWIRMFAGFYRETVML